MNVPSTLVVAKSPMVTPMSPAPGSPAAPPPSPATVDPVNAHAPPAERQREATGSDAELERGPVPASSARKLTAGSTTAGSNSSGHLAS